MFGIFPFGPASVEGRESRCCDPFGATRLRYSGGRGICEGTDQVILHDKKCKEHKEYCNVFTSHLVTNY